MPTLDHVVSEHMSSEPAVDSEQTEKSFWLASALPHLPGAQNLTEPRPVEADL